MKNECEHIVGFFYPYEEEALVGIKELKDIIIRYNRHYGYNHSISDFADNGENVCFERFEFCPRCGQHIDWERLKKENGNDRK